MELLVKKVTIEEYNTHSDFFTGISVRVDESAWDSEKKRNYEHMLNVIMDECGPDWILTMMTINFSAQDTSKIKDLYFNAQENV